MIKNANIVHPCVNANVNFMPVQSDLPCDITNWYLYRDPSIFNQTSSDVMANAELFNVMPSLSKQFTEALSEISTSESRVMSEIINEVSYNSKRHMLCHDLVINSLSCKDLGFSNSDEVVGIEIFRVTSDVNYGTRCISKNLRAVICFGRHIPVCAIDKYGNMFTTSKPDIPRIFIGTSVTTEADKTAMDAYDPTYFYKYYDNTCWAALMSRYGEKDLFGNLLYLSLERPIPNTENVLYRYGGVKVVPASAGNIRRLVKYCISEPDYNVITHYDEYKEPINTTNCVDYIAEYYTSPYNKATK